MLSFHCQGSTSANTLCNVRFLCWPKMVLGSRRVSKTIGSLGTRVNNDTDAPTSMSKNENNGIGGSYRSTRKTLSHNDVLCICKGIAK